MSEQTPRINAPLIDKFRNTTVRIVGKVVDVKEDTAVIDAQGQIQLQLQRVRYPAQACLCRLAGVSPSRSVSTSPAVEIPTMPPAI